MGKKPSEEEREKKFETFLKFTNWIESRDF